MNNKKLLISLFFLISFSVNAFDIKSYCKHEAEFMQGGYAIEEMCVEQETQSKQELESMMIPPSIDRYCSRQNSILHGGYAIKEMCVQQEMEAKQKLGE
jgi:hypothetical protein